MMSSYQGSNYHIKIYVETSFGKTHLIETGNQDGLLVSNEEVDKGTGEVELSMNWEK